jgi:hypothetical protein
VVGVGVAVVVAVAVVRRRHVTPERILEIVHYMTTDNSTNVACGVVWPGALIRFEGTASGRLRRGMPSVTCKRCRKTKAFRNRDKP